MRALRKAASGKVAEWSNAPDSKFGIRFCRIVGSNPTLSASLSVLNSPPSVPALHEVDAIGTPIKKQEPELLFYSRKFNQFVLGSSTVSTV